MTARFPVKISTFSFKKQRTATLSVTKTDILLQGRNDINQSGETNRLLLKISNKNSSSKKVAILSK